jgi:hypothetical protein
MGGWVMNVMANQVLQITGALLILAAFAAAQAGWLHHKSLGYLLPNLIGSVGLAAAAMPGHQWGFLLLEGSWAITSMVGTVTVLVRSRQAGHAPEPRRPGMW